MTAPKYSRNEHERRWLVPPESDWRARASPHRNRLTDRYLSCGRLRVRRITRLDTGEEVLKLTKKYPWTDPLARPLTTLFLTPEEHATFAALPGLDLVKVRHYVEEAGRRFGVDVFEGPLAGLVICECECETRAEAASVPTPSWVGQEITASPAYACAELAARGLPTP